ncbi:uncharacterized protein [Labrus bergylta]|uniref:uncharacterized protein n=1 Tax=Labrus bergylta TaxID=56723 RepID=UPI0033141D85
MSNERNVEVVGCDASIMRNVWEIREREYDQKMQMEHERIEKSALITINKDWANRLGARLGNYKRPERKPKPVEDKVDENNVWKTKKAQAPPPVPRGVGSGPLGRPGVQSRGLSTPSTTKKDKKLPEKGLMKLQLLLFINQTQPSSMVWGKSWKYNKALPLPVEGTEARSDWGHCWMFATQQPYTKAGMPWKNGPNMMDPNILHFWEKFETRMVESQELDLSLPAEEWQVSWRKSDKTNKDTSSEDGENLAKSRLFNLLEETQQYNEELCSSEWNKSWMSTKPGTQQDNFTAPNNGLTNKSKQNNNNEMSSMLENWKLANHLGRNNVKTSQNTKSLSSAWVDSWRAAMTVFNNHKNSSTKQGDTYDHNDQQRESNHHKVIVVPHEQKNKNLNMQLWEEFEALAEWTKSWQVTKNNSKPCEELEKVLKLSQVTTSEAQKVESKTKGNSSTSGNVDPRYEQLKHSTIYHPRREFAQSQLLRLKHLGNDSSTSEWKDSFKSVKHRMRMERRRYRPDPSSPFRGAERGGDNTPAASEWTNSWKFTCQPLRQEPEAWQQGWTTAPQVRVDRARELNHFAPVELPKNGPTSERTWEQSWRFSRRQRQSQPGEVRPQTSQGSSSVSSNNPDNSWNQRRYRRSVSDWQEAWMVSETQFRQDRPSLTQWRDSWQWSVFHTDRWTEQVPRENRLDALMEIQPQRDWMSMQRAQAKISRSFDTKLFREQYPEKEWNASWKASPLLSQTPSISGSSGATEKTLSSNIQQHHGTTNGHGSKWGRSFRIANPMPQVEQPWVESSPNTSCYTVMWFREMNTQNKINPMFSNNPANFSQWGPSHRFLQGASAQSKDKTKSKVTVDPMVIVTKHISTRKHLYSNIEKEKQGDKKWAGCHLLGKTQPRPKRGPASKNMPKMTDENNDKMLEEWAESWRFLVKPGSLKTPVKSLKGWNDSWKFLIPPYQPMNGHKTR